MPLTATQLRVNKPTTPQATAEAVIATTIANRRGLVLQGMPSQTSDLLQLQTSAGSTITNFTADGVLRIGPSLAGTQPYTPLVVTAQHRTQFEWAHVSLMTNDALAADKGAALMLGGVWNDTGGVTAFGRVSAGKDTATTGEGAGYLSFWTRYQATNNLTERLRIPSTAGLQIRDGGTILAAFDATGNLDLKKHQLQNAVTHNLATAPAAPVEGQRYYDTVSKLERVWDGTKWTDLTDVWVGPNAPTGTPAIGDVWYDSDDVSTLVLPLTIANGGTGATTAQAARTSLAVPDLPVAINQGGTGAVTAALARTGLAVPAIGNSTTTGGAPTTGTWVRGDQWLDSLNVLWVCTTGGTPGTWMAKNIGEELAYNESTANTTLTNGAATAHLVCNGTTRTYDGSPIIVEFYAGTVTAPNGSGLASFLSLWDAADMGVMCEVYNSPIGVSVFARRRLTPTPGTHNYRMAGWVNGGTGVVYTSAAGGAGGVQMPAYVRVTRA